LLLPGTPRPLALYTSDVCVRHSPGGSHPEQPARLSNLLRALRTEWQPEFGERLRVCEPRADVTRDQLLRVHTEKHVAQVDRAFRSLALPLGGRVNLDSDTIVSQGTQAAAKRAAGLVVAAVDDLFSRNVVNLPNDAERPRRAFVMARPPGHHAEGSGPQGFCLYNNVMVGVAHAQAVYGVRRVAILDFDVHHGNGDAEIAWSCPSRLYVSSHEVPLYPNTGEKAGREGKYRNVLSAPLPANAGSRDFRRVWRWRLLPAVRAFRPEAIFLSAGFDAHRDDPLSSVKLDDRDFEWITAEVAAISGGRIPIISVLEGGYNVEQLERSVKAHVAALIKA